MSDIEKQAYSLLDLIERQEYKSLQWGFVDGRMPICNLNELGQSVSEAHDSQFSAQELIDDLESRRLIFITQDSLRGDYCRSRISEGVRLIKNLRQIFRNNDWQDSPELISDFRIKIDKRRFPQRNVLESEAFQKFNEDSEYS